MIIGVPFDVVVRRTARVRLALTVTGCIVVADVDRTARLREAAVAAVTGVIVAAEVTVVMLLPLLLIIVGSDAADGTERLPIARDCFVDGAVAVAVVVVVAGVLALD